MLSNCTRGDEKRVGSSWACEQRAQRGWVVVVVVMVVGRGGGGRRPYGCTAVSTQRFSGSSVQQTTLPGSPGFGALDRDPPGRAKAAPGEPGEPKTRYPGFTPAT